MSHFGARRDLGTNVMMVDDPAPHFQSTIEKHWTRGTGHQLADPRTATIASPIEVTPVRSSHQAWTPVRQPGGHVACVLVLSPVTCRDLLVCGGSSTDTYASYTARHGKRKSTQLRRPVLVVPAPHVQRGDRVRSAAEIPPGGCHTNAHDRVLAGLQSVNPCSVAQVLAGLTWCRLLRFSPCAPGHESTCT